jgi:hypothetical protein
MQHTPPTARADASCPVTQHEHNGDVLAARTLRTSTRQKEADRTLKSFCVEILLTNLLREISMAPPTNAANSPTLVSEAVDPISRRIM